MNNLDYENDINIDPSSLDIEWVRQAELMHKYASHAADTKRDMDDAKECLDTGKAKIEMLIRNVPDQYGLAKVTEGAIQSTILLQEDYQELAKVYGEAKYENDIALAAVRAIDQKKTALENLVKLLGQSYFAGPQAPRDLSGEWAKEQERKDKNKKVKIARRRTGHHED